ncbi:MULTISPECIES: hypothetical protein [Haloferax]|uniref:Uncharacterized protein n=1 Tax=Haloferax marinum TaxID=2666143 RepID=A0A6A8G7Z9_9EURY|nr:MULTISPECIES: hypothetical protein [Haloferax]KAB1198185.1 hypothetical protein Hfx1150_11935 [Haloferax sp. CBA1150]MRW97269.1 hypothetical protein [Haloferax marinum]
MSRTGPDYVESEAELHRDLDLKQKQGEISEETAQSFRDLYEFAKELGDDVRIGKAKNANFRMYVDAHQEDYHTNPSVFSANVSGLVKIWPANMPYRDNEQPPVTWDEQDYVKFKRSFQGLQGIPQGDQEVSFQTLVSTGNLDAFEAIVEEFVSTCRQRAD